MPTVAALIREDHREVERLFDTLTEEETRPLTLPIMVAMLSAHSRAEEEVVYPTVRDESESKDVVSHSQEEHVQADELLERLLRTDAEGFASVLSELVDAVRHHIEEEESTVLPLLERLESARQEALAVEFAAIRSAHLLKGRPIDLTRRELHQQARNAGLDNRSGSTKQNLETRLRRMASKD
jgi:hemerythrin superfamily protein